MPGISFLLGERRAHYDLSSFTYTTFSRKPFILTVSFSSNPTPPRCQPFIPFMSYSHFLGFLTSSNTSNCHCPFIIKSSFLLPREFARVRAILLKLKPSTHPTPQYDINNSQTWPGTSKASLIAVSIQKWTIHAALECLPALTTSADWSSCCSVNSLL